MNFYTITSKQGYPLITVLAENEAQAQLKAKEQVRYYLNGK